ncbi:MAG: hypothetical protein NT038_04980 [Euryarchaeota archaeon]|nr:hypothetical protein [Euryarchaeota archaeon]
MGRRLVVVGVTGVIFLLILAMFPSIVSAQKVQLNETQKNVFQHFKDKIENKLWEPGNFLDDIMVLIFMIIWLLVTGGVGPGAP